MQRREAFGTLGVGHAVRLQPLPVATRTGDKMNVVREGVDPMRDKGTRSATVNRRSRVRLVFAGILACLGSVHHLTLDSHHSLCAAPLPEPKSNDFRSPIARLGPEPRDGLSFGLSWTGSD